MFIYLELNDCIIHKQLRTYIDTYLDINEYVNIYLWIDMIYIDIYQYCSLLGFTICKSLYA